ncbi:hypothetical protein [Siphonobacter sp. SORGH_AS_1065]|uniref:hypothetical protein n=1 Tax=Siphonobacter sp. SORGH_AS_1065 TaxID=3041795 RepID=UPI00278ACCA1|nr:hypothetical protein [Siphonobacter sp. SORGH_AS_1065]MDQ1086982.1 hypothetical protein [Siphonobacter sp. SORGH_AS_1065]
MAKLHVISTFASAAPSLSSGNSPDADQFRLPFPLNDLSTLIARFEAEPPIERKPINRDAQQVSFAHSPRKNEQLLMSIDGINDPYLRALRKQLITCWKGGRAEGRKRTRPIPSGKPFPIRTPRL